MNGNAPAIDVSGLPPGAFGPRNLSWWATSGIMFIEGTAFVLTIGAYFYLQTRTSQWPPDGVAPPDLMWGTLNVGVLLASAIPNQLARRAAEEVNLRGARLWLSIAIAFGVVFNIIRCFEFGHLNVSWSRDAYGSILWLLLGLHTTHIVTDVLDSFVLAVLLFVGPLEEKHFVDLAENSIYWYFVVLSWLPIYGVIYWAPRLL